jgi:hypothetical protein
MEDLTVFQATLGLWMYFWVENDWGPVVEGPAPGTLLLLGVGRGIAIFFALHEAAQWILA